MRKQTRNKLRRSAKRRIKALAKHLKGDRTYADAGKAAGVDASQLHRLAEADVGCGVGILYQLAHAAKGDAGVQELDAVLQGLAE